MRIISWNVNGLKSHLKPEKWQYLNDLIKNYDPDILLMQETKLSENDEHKYKIYEKFKDYSFDNVKSPKKGYAGVASLIKSSAMKLGEKTFGVNGDFGKISFASDIKFPDTILNGRCLTYELGDIYLVNTYVQNSGDGLKNLLYRDKIWDKKMKEYLDELESKKPVIWAGDLNVAHHEIDLANPEKNRNNTAGFTDTDSRNATYSYKRGEVMTGKAPYHIGGKKRKPRKTYRKTSRKRKTRKTSRKTSRKRKSKRKTSRKSRK